MGLLGGSGAIGEDGNHIVVCMMLSDVLVEACGSYL